MATPEAREVKGTSGEATKTFFYVCKMREGQETPSQLSCWKTNDRASARGPLVPKKAAQVLCPLLYLA